MSIILYTKSGCPWCHDVLDLFAEKNVKFEEREVLKNPQFFEELKKKSGQNKTPTLDIDGEILADTDREAVEKYLKDKNYPGF